MELVLDEGVVSRGAEGDEPGGVSPLSEVRVRALLERLPVRGSTPRSQVTEPNPEGVEVPSAEGVREVFAETGSARPSPSRLSVISVTPAGETRFAPYVTVVFSEPMVPLGVDGEPLAGEPPVRMDPQTPGVWRWLDVRTLRFEPDRGRLPGATEFTLWVAENAASLSGNTLGEPGEWRFRTTGARALGGTPHGGRGGEADLLPTIFLSFDQKVDPEAVLAAGRLEADGVAHGLRLALPQELTEGMATLAEGLGEGMWAALRPEGPLPPGAEAVLSLDAGLHSEEGPLPAGRAQELRFRVREEFRVTTSTCSNLEERCHPQPWEVSFSSSPERDQPIADYVRIQPEVEDLYVHVTGSAIRLSGNFRPHSSYRAELSPEIRDEFGQRLGRRTELEAHFGRPWPTVHVPGAPFFVLDPAANQRIEVPARGLEELEFELYRVEPEDWTAFRRGLLHPNDEQYSSWSDGRDPEFTWSVQAEDGGMGYSLVPVDLTPAFSEGGSHAVLVVRGQEGGEPEPPTEISTKSTAPLATAAAWIQSTSFALGATWSPEELVTWSISTRDGEPVPGVEVFLPEPSRTAVSDSAGLARLPLTTSEDSLVVGRKGEEVAILPALAARAGLEGWTGDPTYPKPLWFTLTDRGLYQPGEELDGHGWIRELGGLPRRDLAFPTRVDSVRYRVVASGNQTVAEGTLPVTPSGAFHLTATLPPETRSGRARLHLSPVSGAEEIPGWDSSHYFRVEAFRRPDYRVTAEVDPGPHLPGSVIEARVSARYYDGASLPGSSVKWTSRAYPGSWSPPRWTGWVFGSGPAFFDPDRYPWTLETQTLEATTDPNGDHVLRVATGALAFPAPVRVSVNVEVTDVNRQAGSASVATTVHPSLLTAGLRLDRHWLAVGEELGTDVVVTDLDGRVVRGVNPIVRAFLEADPNRVVATHDDLPVPIPCEPGVEENLADQDLRPLRCHLRPTTPGRYRMEAEVADEEGRRSLSEVRVYAYGGTWAARSPGPPQAAVTPEKPGYEPGDTARVMVTAPIYPASGLLTVDRHGIRDIRPLFLDGPELELGIPIFPEDAGGLRVTVSLAPTSAGSEPWTAYTSLNVGMEDRRLAVRAEMEEERVGPGAEVAVEVEVSDAAGRPAAGGEVTIWAVDEAILDLGGYALEDPLARLHPTGFEGEPGSLLPHRLIRWKRKPLGPGILSAELLDALTGAPMNWLGAALDGEELTFGVTQGTLILPGVEPGTHHLRLSRGRDPLLELDFVMPPEGLDLGTLLLEGPGYVAAQRRSAEGVMLAATTFEDRSIELSAMTVLASRIEAPATVLLRGRSTIDPEIGGLVDVRELFRALATFQANVLLDDEGRSRVSFRLPDTMTRYRIFAVATQGPTRFGTAESVVTAAKDLVVRATPPRSLRPGDEPELSVTVQNASALDGTVEVAARAEGLELTGVQGFRVHLPAGARQEIRIPARAPRTGSAELEVLAVATLTPSAGPSGRGTPASTEVTDAVRVPVVVHPALAPRAVAFHERVEAGSSLKLDLEVPRRAEPGYGGVEVDLSTTLLLPLVDVIRGLCLEPMFWPEATSARVLGLAALGDAMEALTAADLPTVEEIRARTAADVERLEGWLSRHRSGRTGWAGPEEGFLSQLSVLHAVHAILVAEEAGYLETGRTASRYDRVVTGIWEGEWAGLRAGERPRSGWEYATPAYALYLAERLGLEPVTPEVERWLLGLAAEDLPVEVLGWILAPASRNPGLEAVRGPFLQELANRAATTGTTVTFRQGGRWEATTPDLDIQRFVLASARRSDAAAAVALLEEDPGNPLLPGLVRGLLGHRGGDRGSGAHESGWVLLALGRYASVQEEAETELTAVPRLDAKPFSEPVRLGPENPTEVATGPLPTPGVRIPLEVETEGTGSLYVRAGVRYAPVVTRNTPADERGFLVSRRYESVDDSTDVRLEADGTWRIRAGARVRVRLTFTAPARRYLVRLRDAIPGGFEVVNPNLKGNGFTGDPGPPPSISAPRGMVSRPVGSTLRGGIYGWDLTRMIFSWRAFWGGWATHEQLRDDVMEAYTPFLPAGTYQTTYLVRATTPGTFLAPPPRVEETEHPETFGQGKADQVVVEVFLAPTPLPG